MDLSRQLKSTALVLFLITLVINSSYTRYHGRRHKRQHGAHLYLPESYIIPDGEADDPIEWGPWSTPSECSRSCGGGVAYQTRECLNFGPRGNPVCKGGNRKFYSCNTQDCPDDEQDFRVQQCSRFNNVPVEGRRHQWIPYTKAPNPCELNCMPPGERFYYRHKTKVIDGTRCNDESLDVCVDGICQPVGCDMMLGSPAREDKCRQCAGDGTSCKTVSGILDMDNLIVGYNDLLLIPNGATNIDIHEIAPSNNYLACRNSTAHYYLNGNWRIDFPRPIPFAGSVWNYDRRPQGFSAPDRLSCLGPINEPIYLVLLYQDRNVGIKYEYSIPESAVQTPDTYGWAHTKFEPCSVTCGGGFQTRNVTCTSRTTAKEVDNSLCDASMKPPDTQQCGQEKCAPKWVEGSWGKCSKPCGSDGKQKRIVQCERFDSKGVSTNIDDSVCLKQVGNKPATEKECNVGKKCPKWHKGPWQPCNKLCGEGKQTRRVTCYKEEKGKKKILKDNECPEEKPKVSKICLIRPCEGVEWITSSWSGCKACGQSQETRNVICATKNGKIFNETFCTDMKPELVRSCKAPPCKYHWFASEWSKCSAECGKGVQTRIVLCGHFDGKSVKPAENDSKCHPARKPKSSQECETKGKECPGQWFAGPWEECSKTCGGGERHREILCLSDGKPSANCAEDTIESSVEKCNPEPCTKDETIPVNKTAKPIVDDEDGDEYCDEDEDGVEIVTTKFDYGARVYKGDVLGGAIATESSLLTDQLMLSDATFASVSKSLDSSTHIPGIAVEGSGGSEVSLDESEGSGYGSPIIQQELSNALEAPITEKTVSPDVSKTNISSESQITDKTSTDSTTISSNSSDVEPTIPSIVNETISSDTTNDTASDLKPIIPSSVNETASSATPNDTASDVKPTTPSSVNETASSGTTNGTASDVKPTTPSSVNETASSGTTNDTASDVKPTTPSSVNETASSATTNGTASDVKLTTPSSVNDTASSGTTNGTASDVKPTTPSSVNETTVSDMTKTTSSDITETTSSDITETTSSDITETTSSDITETTSSDITETTSSDITETTSSDITETTSSDITETTSSDITETTSSDLTETTSSDITETTSSDITETTSSDITETTSSDITETTSSDITETTSSDITETTSSDITETTSSDITETTSSDLTETTSSDITETTSSDITETTSSDITETTSSDITETTSSDITERTSSDITETTSSDITETTSSDITETTSSDITETPSSSSTSSSDTTDSSTKMSTLEKSTDTTLDHTTTSELSSSIGSTLTSLEDSTKYSTEISTEQISRSSVETSSDSTSDLSTLKESSTVSGSTEEGTTSTGETTASGITEEGTISGASDESTVSISTTESITSETVDQSTSGSTESDSTAQTEISASTTESLTSQSTEEGETSGSTSGSISTDTTESSSVPESTTTSSLIDESTISGTSAESTESTIVDTTMESSTLTTDVDTTSGSTEELGSTESMSTSSDVEETTFDIWSTTEHDLEGSTPNTLEAAVTKEQTTRKCKPRKSQSATCVASKFGCCPDKTTPAKGPFDKGCKVVKTCNQTTYGCCPDGLSPAPDKDNKGCPESQCGETLFGCCPDGWTPAEGDENEGCPEPPTTTTIGGCAAGKFGCCPDGISEATGPNDEGCDDDKDWTTTETSETTFETTTQMEETTTERPVRKSCSFSKHGCCPDGKTKAKGKNFKGCKIPHEKNCTKSIYGCCRDNKTSAAGPNEEGCAPCLTEPYGCCPDGKNPAHGYNKEGCCLQTRFGCCPDNVNPAQGPRLEGCSCESSLYGCCPDKKTPAKGHNNEGCDCEYSQFGCCPDKVTLAQGEKFEGCPCHSFQFGCCPDGVTVPQGPHNYGCHCSQTEFKCCSDDVTAAKGPNFEGCTCATSKYGCCSDGVTEAQGSKFEGCLDIRESPQKACSYPKDVGPCNNFTIKHFYDIEYGGCSRFWYGGCEGNNNKFESAAECKANCEEPAGKDACLLPRVPGPCQGFHKQFYFDSDRNTCAEFIYGGCLGNNNRFETLKECQSTCAVDESIPPCEQPVEQGPCDGAYERWYYDTESDVCRPFSYGGCKGNKNNYASENACIYHCKQPGTQQASCALTKETGDCGGRHARWYYSDIDQKCMPFYYSGCGGNKNNYISLEQCEEKCPRQVAKNLCEIPAEVGECQNYISRWYYDTKELRCRQFYYGGCGGNQNNFNDEESCMQRCEKRPATAKPTEHVPPPPPTPTETFNEQNCFLPTDIGPCTIYEPRWYYNSAEGICDQFVYGGCEGNSNNFRDDTECENKCAHVQNTCSLRPIYGRCADNSTRWYFDERQGRCYEFQFSGCRGNRNNFFTERECMNYCQHEQREKPKTDSPLIDERFGQEDLCHEPLAQGNCNDNIASWFFNTATASCEAFYYSGCNGNGNRFESQEQCERQCGEYRGIDVCRQPADPGPCDQWQTRFFYNEISRVCEPFTYSGCEGTGNRFITKSECESVCIVHEEPTSTNDKAICLLPVHIGECTRPEEYLKRWYYDESRGTCVSFIYTGCAGNRNNFRSFESCYDFCHSDDYVILEPIQTAKPNICEPFVNECRNLHCPYGVRRTYSPEGCERCECENPCSDYRCPEDSNCAVDISEESAFIPICRKKMKPGVCPILTNENSRCDRECYTDADCRGDNKCCSDGCGFVCLHPTDKYPPTTLRPSTQPPILYPGDRPTALEEKPQKEVDVDTPAGGMAILRCYATGFPPPTISWRRGAVILNTNQGRYVLTSSGDLTIVQVHRSDSGTYVCIADNGLGLPVQREVNLLVSDPRPVDAYIVGPKNGTKIVTLKQSAKLRCPAGGHPKPYVTWWRGKNRLPLISDTFETQRDYSLVLKKVELSDLGPYTCEAYAGRGRPASIQITLKAVGPVHVHNKEDEKYLKYLVEPPRIPTTTRASPLYPYRPTRPTSKPIPQPDIPYIEPPRPQIVPVSAQLRLDHGSTFALGADIVVQCDVDGYPTPNVTWHKDDVEIIASNRIQITEQPHRLVIYGATAQDTGHYKCTATNQFGNSYHQELLTVDGIYVNPDCKDNPFFANCILIVKGNYCSNQYYAKFCCRSCTLAGQISGVHPNEI